MGDSRASTGTGAACDGFGRFRIQQLQLMDKLDNLQLHTDLGVALRHVGMTQAAAGYGPNVATQTLLKLCLRVCLLCLQ